MSKFKVLSRIQHDAVQYEAGDTFEGEDAVTRPLVEAGVLEATAEKAKEPAQAAPKAPEAPSDTKTDEETKPAATAAKAGSQKAKAPSKPASK